MQLKMAALLAITLPAAGLSACGDPQFQYRLPVLNEADQQRLECAAPPAVETLATGLPAYAWLATSAGEVVEAPDGTRYVTFSSANAREAELLRRINAASAGHFECWDDLEWVGDLWDDPALAGED